MGPIPKQRDDRVVAETASSILYETTESSKYM